MKDITKHYTNGEVTIVWKPEMCIHSRICWHSAKGLPEVFQPAKRPWISPDAASTERIIEQVKQCPSGALSYFMNADADKQQDQPAAGGTVAEVTKDGPLLVHGEVLVKHHDGSETRRNKVTAFCRCGASDNKPYCDGSHTKCGFTG